MGILDRASVLIRANINDLIDLKPSPDHMDVRRARHEVQSSATSLGATEPAEEEEEVAWSDAFACEDGLVVARLSEERPPAGLAWICRRVHVGVEMGTEVRLDRASRDTGGDSAEIVPIDRDVLIGDP